MKTRELATNKWRYILPSFGLDNKYLTGKHTACPICGGSDRFRFDDRQGRGTYYCNNCGAGDGFDLLKNYKHWSFRKVASEIDRIISALPASTVKHTEGDARKEALLQKQRARMTSIKSGDSVGFYLSNRRISPATIDKLTSSLSLIKNLEYWQDGKIQGNYDSMAALIEADSKIISHHITYLDNGSKAKLNPSRKIMPTSGSVKGCAVRLFKHEGVLGIAEGIETALSATELTKIPTWAALSANGLSSFVVPESVTELHIFADNDQNYIGQKAAIELAQRAFKNGITAKIHTPHAVNSDWNDALTKQE